MIHQNEICNAPSLEGDEYSEGLLIRDLGLGNRASVALTNNYDGSGSEPLFSQKAEIHKVQQKILFYYGDVHSGVVKRICVPFCVYVRSPLVNLNFLCSY